MVPTEWLEKSGGNQVVLPKSPLFFILWALNLCSDRSPSLPGSNPHPGWPLLVLMLRWLRATVSRTFPESWAPTGLWGSLSEL